MILKIFIIGPGGVLCCSKEYFSQFDVNEELISGFLQAISDFAEEISVGKIQVLEFHNFKFVYSYTADQKFIVVMVIEKNDLESEARPKIDLMKNEFIKRYEPNLRNWSGDISVFEDFKQFIEDNIYIPCKVLITGEKGVGKTSIINLIKGETILDLDDDLKETFMKIIAVSDIPNLKQCVVKEIDIKELIKNVSRYKILLKSLDIIFFVSNSAASNLGRINDFLAKLRLLVSKAEFYIIANFQDSYEIAFEPEKIENTFGIKTYGFTAVKKKSSNKFMQILKEVLETLVERKEYSIKSMIGQLNKDEG
ncbi:MAG: hypothetical protein ACFE8N_11035 [Promethearchaeota archaeon]